MIRRFAGLVPIILILSLSLLVAKAALAQGSKEIPREWIDPDTGHRVIRLSDEPGSQSLYFHQNGYTPDGEALIITTPTGLSAVNLKTRAVEKIVQGRVNMLVVGRKTGQVYYVKDRTVYATDIHTHATREIGKLPARGSISTVNADETLLAGAITEGEASAEQGSQPATTTPANPPPES